MPKFARPERLTWIALLAIILVGAVLRLVRLGSVPPGLHFDEAVYGLMARDIVGGHYPLFFPTYTGREPLYMYLMAAVFRLVGISTLGIRLTSALIGIATIPLVFLLMRSLHSPRVGLLAAAFTSLSYWHLTVSRNGYPNILIPPIECLALYFLWKGYRRAHYGWMALGGALVGLVLYTYLAARFFPLTVALIFGYVLVVDGERNWRRLGGLALAALAALAVFAPLGAYFLRHPEFFFERASQVLVFREAHAGEQTRLLLHNVLRSLGGFFIEGDARWHFNLPLRPIFTPAVAPFFVLGAGLALWRWRRPEYALLILWTLGMMTPAILTDDGMPQGQRMFGITPAIFGLAALGLDAAWGWASLRFARARRTRLWQAMGYALLAALLLFEGVALGGDYFGRWARHVTTFYTFDSDYALLAQRARQEVDAGRTVVIQSLHYRHPTVLFIEPRVGEAALWSVGDKTLAIPHRPGSELLYLWPAKNNPLQGGIEEVAARLLEEVEVIPDPEGAAAVRILQPRADILEAEAQAPALATFGDEVAVLGWELPERARRDKALRLVVHWRALREVGAARSLSLHLVDRQGVLWAQDTGLGYFSEQWRAGDAVYQLFELPIPSGLPAGPYEARLLLNDQDTKPLPVYRAGEPLGVHLSLGEVNFKSDGRRIEPLHKKGMALGHDLIAIDYAAGDLTAAPGGELRLPVTWQARTAPEVDYTITLALLDETGAVRRAQEAPLAYAYPTSAWEVGEVVQVVYVLPLQDVEAGIYTLRLRVQGVEGELDLGQVSIAGLQRLWEPPPMQTALSATWGEAIALLGYDLAARHYAPGDELSVTLYWQAQATLPADLKVFVHLIGPDERIWGQHDGAPANWTRPTMGWAEGEIVVDTHTFTIGEDAPPGEYRLCLGWYDAATLRRWPVASSEAEILPADRLVLTQIRVAP